MSRVTCQVVKTQQFHLLEKEQAEYFSFTVNLDWNSFSYN